MDPVTNKILQGIPYAGMGSTLERNALIGVIRNLISEDKYTVDYILNYAESVGYQRQMAEDVFKELTGLSPVLIVNNNEYYKMPAYVPNMCIAWGTSKSNKEKAFYVVPFEYGYAVMEKDEVNAPIPTVISATIPEAIDELKKVAKGIQTLDKIITKKLLETENVQTVAETPHQVNKPYTASPLQVLKKNFKDKVINVSEFERQASKLLAADEITVDEAEKLMTWKQELIDEDESYANDTLQLDENWDEVKATVEFDDIMNEVKTMANDDEDFINFEEEAKEKFEANKDLFQNVDLIEGATRLYQLLLGFSKDEILGNSKVEKKMNKKSFQMHSETGIREFQPWDEAKKTWKHIIEQGKADAFDKLIEKCYPEGISKTQLNDLLWFESDWVYETLGMQNSYKDEEEEGFKEDASLKQAKDDLIHNEEDQKNFDDVQRLVRKNEVSSKEFDLVAEMYDLNNEIAYLSKMEMANCAGEEDIAKKKELLKRYNELEQALKSRKYKNASLKKKALYIPEDDAIIDAAIKDGWPEPMVLATYSYLLKRTGEEKKINDELIKQVTQFINDFGGRKSEETKYDTISLEELAKQLGFKKEASKKVKSKQITVNVYDIDWDTDEDSTGEYAADELPDFWDSITINVEDENDDNEIEDEIANFLSNEYGFTVNGFHFTRQASKKVTAENMDLDDIEAEDNKDTVQEEIDKINEKPAEEVFSETTPEQYFEDALSEDKVDTINEVVSKCIDKFSEKFKEFDKYNVEILSYNTKVLGDYKPNEEELVEDKELNANAILEVILAITNNADESNLKKALAVFSIANGELHWTGTVRGENDQVVAFTEEGLDALFEVEEPSEDELEDII